MNIIERIVANTHFDQFVSAPTDQYSVLGWIVLLPLLGAIINGVWGKKLGRQGVYIAGVGAVASSFLLSILAFVALLKTGHHEGVAEGAAEGAEHARRAVSYVAQVGGKPWDWILAPTGATTAEMIRVRYVVDPLSGIMLLVVTGIGTLIHIYSTGYMSHDGSYHRFFAYLNLFVFAMLNLILGDSLALMFLGWEGVGLASYLLIGFWFTNPDYAFAGRKAFIVNRIGDAGLILGIAILAWKGGSYRFETLHEHVSAGGSFLQALHTRTGLGPFLADALPVVNGNAALVDFFSKLDFTWGGLACLLLFIGACGKSAQIPLYVWLPDAMAGPTPVSALIHAATMVTAGIYLLNRLSFLYVYYTSVLSIIGVIGAATALFAATIAVTQTELKKVLAYSTVSQLGYMFLACGLGAFGAGFFHVFTHAFFKACLFLGAGAVMHACGDRQDMTKLGGLRTRIPLTFWTMAVSTAAIIGFPLSSGFFSKDEILWRAFAHPNHRLGYSLYAMGVLAALLTAFYMCRMMFLTFFGDGPKYLTEQGEHSEGHNADDHAHTGHDDGHDHGHGHDDHGHGEPSEAGLDMKLMTYPLIALAAMAAGAGLLNLPHWMIHQHGTVATFLHGTVADAMEAYRPEVREVMFGKEIVAMIGGVSAFILGAGGAYWVYIAQRGEPAEAAAKSMKGLYELVLAKWKVDELYDATVVRGAKSLSTFSASFDRWVIDGLVNLTGSLTMILGRVVKPIHNGSIQLSGAAIGLGAMGVVAWAVLFPQASIAHRAGDGGQTIMEVSGGPGYVYRWAVFAPELGRGSRVSDVCTNAAIATNLGTAQPTRETQRTETVTEARCVAVEATNPFGRVTQAITVILPPGANTAAR
ncbi:MAG: NADH-quinone oxidoreductase subunit L [Polyangiales bacterium]